MFGAAPRYRPRRSGELWWANQGDKEVHAKLFGLVEQLHNSQDYRRDMHLHLLRMYSNRLASGLSGSDYAISAGGERIRINVIKAVIDAAAAQIASSRPRPMYLTTGGNYSQRLRAQRLNKFMSGAFHLMDIYASGLLVFFDAAIFGTGYLKVFHRDGDIRCERTFPGDVLVDDVEARDGRPRNMYQHMVADKHRLAAMFPKHRAEIMQAAQIGEATDDPSASELCSVIEGWHLPSKRGVGDGRHVIGVSTKTLMDVKWERDSFPFAEFRWCHSPLGYDGIGLAEELTPIQVEINYLAQKFQQVMNLFTTQLWVHENEDLTTLSNRDGAVGTFKNNPPVAISPQPLHAQFFQWFNDLYYKAFEISGVSHSSATSQVPQGLKSGEAIKRHNEVGSKRFQHVAQDWERFYLDASEIVLDCAREIEEQGGGSLKVLAEGDKDVEEISFSEVAIDKNKYVVRVFPTSLLPDTPQGKVDTIMNLAQVSPEMQSRMVGLLTGIPDVEHIANRVNAQYEIIDKQIERILEHGDFEPPYPYQNLAETVKQSALALLQAHSDDVSEDRIELLRRYMEQAVAMEQSLASPLSPPPPPQPGGGPQATPPGAAPPPGPGGGPTPPLAMAS